MSLLSIPSTVMLVVYVVLLAVKLFAFVSALMFSNEHYRAAGKWTKGGWVALTGIALLLQVFPIAGLTIVNLALTIAAFVYLADVRPALSSLRRR
ncbi:DUF2516 family protein [Nocardioides sp. CER19]|uniref:DUF2516 family protein n=1 Tax=Nocardioides sp. CER19 TaxID=3038538 RepID=UPI00244BB666|nr:DUF2516 family protein [Nocardioides sp. CER19]MDH2413357.1 DUF2516 family protein [Nocardioides sp. CER19]